MAQILYANQYFTTTLNVGGGIDSSQTTGIILSDVSGIDTTKPGIALINYSNPLSTSLCEWVEYTSINGSKELVGVTRGAEGFAAKSHDNGVTVAFPVSESHINRIAEGLDASVNSLGIYNYSMARQAIINGNFDVWQRSTSSAVSAANTFLADRYGTLYAADGWTFPTVTHSQQTLTSGDIPGSFYYYRIASNGAGSGTLGNSTEHGLYYRIERGTRSLCGAGKYITFSVWMRASSAKKVIVSFSQRYGTGGSPSANETIKGNITTLTTSWTKYTFTVTTNTLVGKTFGTDNNDYFQIRFDYLWNTTKAATLTDDVASNETFGAANNIDIAQFSACAGDVALPFLPKTPLEETMSCFRYFKRINLSTSTNAWEGTIVSTVSALTTSDARGNIALSVPMRSQPTLTASAASNIRLFNSTSTVTPTALSAVANNNRDMIILLCQSSAGFTGGMIYNVGGISSSYIDLDAEL